MRTFRNCLGLAAGLAFASVAAGCWASSPAERGDFGMTEVAVFSADDGPWCVAAIDTDDPDREVLLLDYMHGVHHYALDGTYLATSVSELETWNALDAHGLAFTGDSAAVLVGHDGAAVRMELGDGTLAPLDMGGRTLGPALGWDESRGVLLATPADAVTTFGAGAASTLLVLDGASGTELGALSVEVGQIKAVTYVPDRDQLLVLGGQGALVFVDPETGATVGRGYGPEAAFGVAYDSETGRVLLATWSLSYRVHTYEIDWH